MSASKYDFNIEQGSSFRLSIVYKDDSNNIVNLTNYCARLSWKDSNNNTKEFVSGTTNSEYKFTIDGINGQILLLIPASTTNNFSFNTTKYDLELQSPTDLYTGGGKETFRILYGIITLIKRYSQTTTNISC